MCKLAPYLLFRLLYPPQIDQKSKQTTHRFAKQTKTNNQILCLRSDTIYSFFENKNKIKNRVRCSSMHKFVLFFASQIPAKAHWQPPGYFGTMCFFPARVYSANRQRGKFAENRITPQSVHRCFQLDYADYTLYDFFQFFSTKRKNKRPFNPLFLAFSTNSRRVD